ncbi:uncharacterized protein LOC110346018 [Heterocephalus glaber]|uniref:Uncharacterized protein LOC110346018 n=1 Tax=Heterocephalus glaber TaxID=10181 RepID=A0AAX6RWX8_HETGA|nr:uncharacterized protein LOC110346018 [Heterocephalus glaber]
MSRGPRIHAQPSPTAGAHSRQLPAPPRGIPSARVRPSAPAALRPGACSGGAPAFPHRDCLRAVRSGPLLAVMERPISRFLLQGRPGRSPCLPIRTRSRQPRLIVARLGRERSPEEPGQAHHLPPLPSCPRGSQEEELGRLSRAPQPLASGDPTCLHALPLLGSPRSPRPAADHIRGLARARPVLLRCARATPPTALRSGQRPALPARLLVFSRLGTRCPARVGIPDPHGLRFES